MSKSAALATGAVLFVVLIGWAAASMWPVNASGYRDRIVAVADGSLSAVRTVEILADADQAGKVLPLYAHSVLDSARDHVATSQYDLATEPVSDADSASLRDELAPLLAAAATLLTDDTALTHPDELRQLGDQLQSFVERHQ